MGSAGLKGFKERATEFEKDLEDRNKYSVPKDIAEKLSGAVSDFKIGYNKAYWNHEDMDKFVSNIKVYENSKLQIKTDNV